MVSLLFSRGCNCEAACFAFAATACCQIGPNSLVAQCRHYPWAMASDALLNKKPFSFNNVWGYLTNDKYGEAGSQKSIDRQGPRQCRGNRRKHNSCSGGLQPSKRRPEGRSCTETQTYNNVRRNPEIIRGTH